MNLITHFRGAAVAAIACLLSTPSLATPVVHHIEGVINAAVVSNPTSIGLPPGYSLVNYNIYSAVSYSGFPLQINDGDTLEFHFTTVNGGLTFTDGGPGLIEQFSIAGLTTNAYTGVPAPGSPNVVSYNYASTLTVQSGIGLTQTSFSYASWNITQVPFFGALVAGNFTNSMATLTDFTVAITYTNIVYLPGYEYMAALNTISSAAFVSSYSSGFPIATPSPAAAALLGLGLAGLGWMRRRNAA